MIIEVKLLYASERADFDPMNDAQPSSCEDKDASRRNETTDPAFRGEYNSQGDALRPARSSDNPPAVLAANGAVSCAMRR
ncbi:MAG: hypothetical protein QOE34_1753 [Verrucomicrobiota bacterium]